MAGKAKQKTVAEKIKNVPGVVQKDPPRVKEMKYKSRENSIKAGIFTSAKISFGDYYLSPFAIAINASNSLVAMLSSIAGLLGPLSQMFGSKLMEKYSRKKIVLKSIAFELAVWAPLAAIAILYWQGIITNALPMVFVFFFSYYVIFSNLGNPAWFSWTGDIINERYRGRWFSKRNLLMGFVAVVLAVGSSFLLDYFKKADLAMIGFSVLFALAFASRIISRRFYKKQYEPKLELKKGDYFSFFNFLVKAKGTNLWKFSIFSSFFNLSVAVASPLFAIYMLRNIGFDYTVYMIITLGTTVFSLLVMELWGKVADKFGDYKVLYVCAGLIPFVPILWVFSKSPWYLLFVPTLLAGISWAGFNLASSNFIYDNVHPEKRGLAISYFNMLNGIGIFAGAGIGALLIKFVNVSFMEPILFIFIISGILRMASAGLLLPRIKEVRKIKGKGTGRGVAGLMLRQFRPVFMGEIHEIMHMKKYLRK